MAKRKEEESFTVSDRRLFSTDGELRSEAEMAEEAKAPQVAEATGGIIAEATSAPEVGEAPPPPSAEAQKAQASAYEQTNRSIDEAISKEMGPGVADLEVTFERFLGSLYMSALMQLGLAHEPNGQPRLDIISARQTIDTIGLLSDKTKGNLTANEQGFLQNALYELRMAYLEVTNALARGPQAGGKPGAAGPVGPGSAGSGSVGSGPVGSGPLVR